MSHDSYRWLGLLGLLAVLAGCPSKPVSEPADAGLAAAEIDAGLPVVDAGPAPAELPPIPVPFTVALAREDGGVEIAAASEGGVAEVDASKEILVTVDAPLADVRVRLFDWTDKVVPSDDAAQPSDAGVAWRIGLLEPLKAGRGYSLMVDAQTGARLQDARGRKYDDGQLKLKVRGEVAPEPKPAPRKKSGKKKRR